MKNEMLIDIAKYLLEKGDNNKIFYFIKDKNVDSNELKFKLFKPTIERNDKSIKRMKSFVERLISKNILVFKNNRPHDFIYYESESNPIKTYMNYHSVFDNKSCEKSNFIIDFNKNLEKNTVKSKMIISNMRKRLVK